MVESKLDIYLWILKRKMILLIMLWLGILEKSRYDIYVFGIVIFNIKKKIVVIKNNSC